MLNKDKRQVAYWERKQANFQEGGWPKRRMDTCMNC